jgi:hypothetical protein
MPRLRGKELEAAAQKVGQDSVRQFVRGPSNPDKARAAEMQPKIIEPVDRVVDHKWADNMAFNEEIVEVTVHTTSDKNAEPIVEVYNNGVPQRFIRGRRQPVKRKFVEVLARAKMTSYGNQKIMLDGGDETYVYPESTALRYPFTVHNDANPRGIDWLKSILAEG